MLAAAVRTPATAPDQHAERGRLLGMRGRRHTRPEVASAASGLEEHGLRIRGAVLRALCGMRSNALLGARDAALEIALGALQTVTQHVKAASMSAVGCGVGHGCLSMVLVGQYARSGS
jgi:hypothetical protein